MIKIRKIKETCLYVRNLDETEKFYHEILALPVISKKEGRHIFFRVGEEVLLCFNPEVTKADTNLPPHHAYGEQHIAFEVMPTEYESAKTALEEKGVIIIHEEKWREHVLSCYFKDPDGHLLEIVAKGLWDY